MMKKLAKVAKIGIRNSNVRSYHFDKERDVYMEGNEAAAEIAFKMTDMGLLYPISPSSQAGEHYEHLAAMNKKNIFGVTPSIAQMQSEAGAGGSSHGALVSGSIPTSFTASQGLLLWYPVLFQMAYQSLPFVLHVAARSVAGNATSISGDHMDVMASRSCGFAFLSSRSPQECYDKGCIAHAATLRSRVPVMHFFDGMVVSHQVNLVNTLTDEELLSMIDFEALEGHYKRGLNSEIPERIGSSCGEYTFQLQESVNPFFADAGRIMQETMDDFYSLTGRRYDMFTYSGHPEAEYIVVAMGATSQSCEDVADYLYKERGEKVGAISCHLYRPWGLEQFLDKLPKSVKRIAVLDRSKDPLAMAEPLCVDVMTSLKKSKNHAPNVEVIGGRYGLAGTGINPSHLMGVFDHLQNATELKSEFLLGVEDDVCGLTLQKANSLGYQKYRNDQQELSSAVFYGKGGDGTVSSVQACTNIIGEQLEGHYSMGSHRHTPHKAGSITVSDLRWSKNSRVNCEYLIGEKSADFVFCNNRSYLKKIDMVSLLSEEGGYFVCNLPFSPGSENIEDIVPNDVLKKLAKRKEECEDIKFVIVDAERVLETAGMPPGKINYVMLTAFLKLSGLFEDEARVLECVTEQIENSLHGKGGVIEKNIKSIQNTADFIFDIPIDPKWKELPSNVYERWTRVEAKEDDPEWVKREKEFVCKVQNQFTEQKKGVPIGNFKSNGFTPIGTSQYEKRGIAIHIPKWIPDNCIQCNECAFQCPHSVIRPFVFSKDNVPSSLDGEHQQFSTIDFMGDGSVDGEEMQFMIHISPKDCTGCMLCTTVCPADALQPLFLDKFVEERNEVVWKECIAKNINRNLVFSRKEDRRQIMLKPYHFEFNGACAGCAEAAALKVICQLYGKRMRIANATGCSTVYSSYYVSAPYCHDCETGTGPAYGRSLFENAGEFGYGMLQSQNKKRDMLKHYVEQLLVKTENNDKIWNGFDHFKNLLNDWLVNFNDGEKTYDIHLKEDGIRSLLPTFYEKCGEGNADPFLVRRIKSLDNAFVKESQWIIGGDGFSYDIGFGGLDHVLASGENFNVFIFDNENYANTGGQSSKASNKGTAHKMSTRGKEFNKKDLGQQMISYGNVYVAQVSLAADSVHFLKTIKEAEAFDGPSLVICYCPCENHYIKGGLGLTRKKTEDLHVNSGLFPLYNYNPDLMKDGKNPFQLRTKKLKYSVKDCIDLEKRYKSLSVSNPEKAERLHKELQEFVDFRFDKYSKLASLDYSNWPLKDEQ